MLASGGPLARGAKRVTDRFRLGALLAAGAVVLHHLHYGLERMTTGERERFADMHSYGQLGLVVAGLLLAMGAATFALDARHARRAGVYPERAPASGWLLWPACSAILLATFVAREALEAWSAGLPVDLSSIVLTHFGATIGFAALVGAAVAMLARGARRVLELIARASRPIVARRLPAPRRPRAAVRPQPQLVFLAGLAGRAPPRAG